MQNILIVQGFQEQKARETAYPVARLKDVDLEITIPWTSDSVDIIINLQFFIVRWLLSDAEMRRPMGLVHRADHKCTSTNNVHSSAL